MKRAEGYYFVFYGGGWRIAYYTDSPIGGCWYMVGHDTTYSDYSFSRIDENRIKRAEDEADVIKFSRPCDNKLGGTH